MCNELGRWLRAAGYDTSLVEDHIEDREIFDRASHENRYLLTRDKEFLAWDPEHKIVIFLRGTSLDGWAKQLRQEEGIDWLFHPFSRCLVCNAILEKTLHVTGVPEGVRKMTNEFWVCPQCQRTFWLGSHTNRMKEKLKSWMNGDSF